MFTVGLFLVAPAAQANAVAMPAANATLSDSTFEATIFSKLNQVRKSAGKKSITRNSYLDAVAASWAKKLAKYDYSVPGGASDCSCHNPNVGSQIPSGWSKAAENVGWVGNYGNSAGTVLANGWRDSPGHYANIVGDYSNVGIATYTKGSTTYGVQVFAKYPSMSVSKPKAKGTAKFGSTLTATVSTKSKSTIRYRWLNNGKSISGATKSKYTLTANDVGDRISVTITANRKGYTTVVKTSKKTSKVAAKKAVTKPLKISGAGARTVGQTLSVATSGWTCSTSSLTYRWYRYTGASSLSAISGGSTKTLTVPAGLAGQKITVKATCAKKGYTTVTRLAPAVTVAAATANAKALEQETIPLETTEESTAPTGVPSPQQSTQPDATEAPSDAPVSDGSPAPTTEPTPDVDILPEEPAVEENGSPSEREAGQQGSVPSAE